MKLLRLDLLAFGPFTNASLDFSGDGGFHLIYGPNEAGKSTLLRAVRGLLFGIPVRSADNFLHEHGHMRIGARLARADGSELEIVRRKGQRNTLLDASQSPLDEAELGRWIGGMNEAYFSDFFGIGHEQLSRGSELLLKEQGGLYEGLFAAGLGGIRLKNLADDLETEAAALFKPRGDNQSLNKALREYGEIKERMAAVLLAGDEFDRRSQALEKARRQQSDIQMQLRHARAELIRLQRIKKCQPLFVEKQAIERELDALGCAPVLSGDFAEKRIAALAALGHAKNILEQNERQMENLSSQLQAVVVPESLIENGETVAVLHRRLGGFLKAAQDKQGLKGQFKSQEDEAQRLFEQLKPVWRLDRTECPRLSPAVAARIQDLGNQILVISQNLKTALLSRDLLSKQAAQVESDLATLPQPRDVQSLRALIRTAPRETDSDLRQMTAGIQTLEAEAASLTQRLELWKGAPADAVAVAMPSIESIEVFVQRFGEWEKRLNDLNSDIDKTYALKMETDCSLREFQLAFDVPSEPDLLEARRIRRQLWESVKDAWRSKPPETGSLDTYAGRFEQEFEQSVARADTLADRLRHEAGRVEKMAGLRSRLQSAEAVLAGLKREKEDHLRSLEKNEAEWGKLWLSAGITPRLPVEMRAWIQKWDKLVQLSEQIIRDRTLLRNLEEKLHTHKTGLCRQLDFQGEAHPALEESMENWAERCNQVLERIDAAEARRNSVSEKIDDLRHRSNTAAHDAARLGAELESVVGEWKTAVERIGLDGSQSPHEINAAIALMGELAGKLDAAAGVRSRIEAIDEDAAQYRADVNRWVQLLSPELASLPLESAVSQMQQRLSLAQQEKTKRENLQMRLQELAADSEMARKKLDEAESVLRALCMQAGCDEASELEAVGRKSAQIQTARQRLGELDRQLLAESSASAAGDFAADAAAVSPDELAVRIDDLERAINELEGKRSEADTSVGSEAVHLAMIDGNAKAAELAEDAQAKLAEIRQLGAQYVQIRMSAGILKREMERYGAENQGPILRRAQEYFKQITLQSFASIATDYDAQDKPVLKGVRPGSDKKVAMDGMSDGARDQLFLALRLASIEHYLDHHEPMPVIVDDILVHFDDYRAKAALALLGSLSERTQILFFTHHSRLMELAAEAVSNQKTHLLRPA